MNKHLNVINVACILVLCALTPEIHAHTHNAHSHRYDNRFFNAPYIGIEAIQTNQNYKDGYGNGVYKKNPQDYNIFAGFKFNKALGLEGGYEIQPTVKKDVTLSTGQSEPGRGEIALPIVNVGMSSKIRGYHPYLGLFLEGDQFIAPGNKIKVQALIGASFSHIRAQDVVTSINGISTNTVNNYSSHKVVPMVKLSATHNLSNNLGVRLSLNYHNFSLFKIKAQNGGNGQLNLKDTFGIGLGLAYSFC